MNPPYHGNGNEFENGLVPQDPSIAYPVPLNPAPIDENAKPPAPAHLNFDRIAREASQFGNKGAVGAYFASIRLKVRSDAELRVLRILEDHYTQRHRTLQAYHQNESEEMAQHVKRHQYQASLEKARTECMEQRARYTDAVTKNIEAAARQRKAMMKAYDLTTPRELPKTELEQSLALEDECERKMDQIRRRFKDDPERRARYEQQYRGYYDELIGRLFR